MDTNDTTPAPCPCGAPARVEFDYFWRVDVCGNCLDEDSMFAMADKREDAIALWNEDREEMEAAS